MKGKVKLIVDRLGRHLVHFHPEMAGKAMCPACLQAYPVRGEDDCFDEAHILPRAAGGKLTTVLCTPCNSLFGRKQDRWFGEYLRALEAPTLIHSQKQQGFFEIDGIRVSGEYRATDEGELRFYIWKNKTSPEALARVMAKASVGGLRNVSIPSLLLRNRELIDIGFLTAAYLLWFRALGYSWALQNHVEGIRKQIRSPDEKIAPFALLRVHSEPFREPWIGAGTTAGELVLLTGLANRVVVFPPADRPDITAVVRAGERIDPDSVQVWTLHKEHDFSIPVAVAVDDRIVVLPDILRGEEEPPVTYVFESGGGWRLKQRGLPDATAADQAAGRGPWQPRPLMVAAHDEGVRGEVTSAVEGAIRRASERTGDLAPPSLPLDGETAGICCRHQKIAALFFDRVWDVWSPRDPVPEEISFHGGLELERSYAVACRDERFWEELHRELDSLEVADQYVFRGKDDVRIVALDKESGAEVNDATESLPMAPLLSELYDMPLLAVLERLRGSGKDFLGDLDRELTRKMVSNYGLETFPLFGSCEARQRRLEGEGEQKAIVIRLSGIEVVDEAALTWEQVRRVRADLEAVRRFRGLTLFEGGPASLCHPQIEEEVSTRISEYRDTLGQFRLPTKLGVIEIAWDPAALAEAGAISEPQKDGPTLVGRRDFEVEEVQVSLLRDELASEPTTRPPYLGVVYGTLE